MKRYSQVPQDVVFCGDLPDGTVSLVDTRDWSVHALDALSSEAWKACAQRRGLDEILQALACQDDLAAARVELALDQLVDLKLLSGTEHTAQPGVHNVRRRELLRVAGAALPVILSLTSAQQKAYAQGAGSGPTTTTTTTGPTTTGSTTGATTTHSTTTSSTTTLGTTFGTTFGTTLGTTPGGGGCTITSCENGGTFNANTCSCSCWPNLTGARCQNYDCAAGHMDPPVCATLPVFLCSSAINRGRCPQRCLCGAT